MLPEVFDYISEIIDIIIHNGAFVHWILPYEKLKSGKIFFLEYD